ncbi:DUF3795 domain-containing protein [Acidobacteriota bacterium]
MDKETVKKMTSPCGLPCFHCSAHLAVSNPTIRKKVSEALNIPEEKATCEGCRSQEGRIKLLKAQKQCSIYKCTTEKNIDFCNECDDFPCERFQPYADQSHYPHNTKMYQLCMMKKLGIEKWAEEEAVKIWDTYRTEPFDFDNILY